ncbi:sensor histidine kinase [Nonomuraea sp. NPDC050478]|uniref:sensor histidine kinase n=1 Tax=Nonomuraea sp. NPDC050478 TaxID=3364365 RepID=UPI00378FE9CA
MRTLALVCGMAVVVLYSTVMAYDNQPGATPLDPAGYALLVTAVLALAWLPRRPEVALAISAGAVAALFTLGYAYAFWPAPALISVFATISTGRRAAGWAGAAFLVAVPAVAAVLHPGVDNAVAVVIWALLVLVAAQPAEVSRARRAYTLEVERRAAEAERGREEEALRRAQEERLRVARELHDVTSHTVSVIALHAAVAAEAVARAGGPPEARDALQVIRDSSRQALAEMKGVLGVLRPRHPLPGSAQLPALARTAGLPVTLETTGEPRLLPPAVDLAVYRVVQEALTNTIRHAGATRATVTLAYEEAGVRVRVDDDGTGPSGTLGLDAGGHGLRGMAERVEAAGGRLTTGAGPAGGFRVAAWMPA